MTAPDAGAMRDRVDAEAYRWQKPLLVPFWEWAQTTLSAGRWAGHDYYSAIRTEFEEMRAELAALRAQEAARSDDAARLDWLAAHETFTVACYGGGTVYVTATELHGEVRQSRSVYSSEGMRRAIDLARGAA